MPKAKADYKSLCEELVMRLEADSQTEATMAWVNNQLASMGAPSDIVPARVLIYFRLGKVRGWTVSEKKGQTLMQRKIVKLEAAVAMAAAEGKPKPLAATDQKEASFGADVIRYVPAKEPEIQYHARRIADGMTDIEVLERAWHERRSVLLVGKPGTGKSTAPWVLAQKLGLPIVRISMDETKDSSKLLGQWVPADGGGFRFVRAPALTMFEQGGLLVIEELNAITPGVAFTLHPMLDDLDVMVVDDLGIVANKHPDFWVVGTMNPSEDAGAAGTQQVNYALWDRFKCKLFYDYDTDIEAKLVHNDERVLKVRDRLRGAEGIRTEVTTRMLRDFWQNIQIFGWEVAKLMFAANFPAEEREQVSEACKLIGG